MPKSTIGFEGQDPDADSSLATSKPDNRNEISCSRRCCGRAARCHDGPRATYGCGADAGSRRDRGNAGELGDQVLDGCNTELARFCAEVAPGEGRLLACLYAHGDKLTRRCDYALYNAAARLERAIGAMTYVVSECRAELERHCAGVDVGEGRVVQCLKDHASELSPGCDQALTEVGVQ